MITTKKPPLHYAKAFIRFQKQLNKACASSFEFGGVIHRNSSLFFARREAARLHQVKTLAIYNELLTKIQKAGIKP